MDNSVAEANSSGDEENDDTIGDETLLNHLSDGQAAPLVQQAETACNGRGHCSHQSFVASGMRSNRDDQPTSPFMPSMRRRIQASASSRKSSMDDLNHIADNVKTLPHLSDDERQRQMSMIYSRRKRLRAKQRFDRLDQECAHYRSANENLRIENVRLEAMLKSIVEQIVSSHPSQQNTLTTLLDATSADLESNFTRQVQQPPSFMSASAAPTSANEYMTALWMQQQQQQHQSPQPPQQIQHPSLVLSSLIGHALAGESLSTLSAQPVDPAFAAGQHLPVLLPYARRPTANEQGDSWQQLLQQQQTQEGMNGSQHVSAGLLHIEQQELMQKLQDSQMSMLQQQQQQSMPSVSQTFPSLQMLEYDEMDEQALLLELLRRRQCHQESGGNN
ncbi:hypothetical protein MPSEU_000530500 [Mayamaea pseudoterrestris]|nr:hypothetical protein MPSEU_000530500 [Mayamaea pseudoterrestris]